MKNIIITKVQGPCKGCEDREPGCHAKCERYKDFRDKVGEDHKKKRQYYGAVEDVKMARYSNPTKRKIMKEVAMLKKGNKR